MKSSPANNSALPDDFDKPIGQILIEAGLISISQIELALREQEHYGLRLGEILVSHGWIKQETIDFFCEQWPELLKQKKQPLAYYFQAASLLDTEQVNAVTRLQKLKHKKVRFHRLAVEQGYLKQKTVDFFLAYLFNIYDPKSISAARPYEVLKNYSNGIRNFARVNLQKAPLMSISLRDIILDGSNLKKADLSQANLSHSSLIQVNLSQANLTKAVLTEVNFTKSSLTRANLESAHLEKTNFESAVLRHTNFRSSYLAQANFAGADLTKAMLPSDYPYDVYYDRDTIFDADFDPRMMGWKEVVSS
ncbi:pentapeptide repeat-containing protein [Pleurocapsales cyanobacterium LEGE 10410]|nr:pentapeptide repeat-containing protein [Pleurocapsales cyanobacterium LEGE 10410]